MDAERIHALYVCIHSPGCWSRHYMVHYICLQFVIRFDHFNCLVHLNTRCKRYSRERHTGCIHNWIRCSKWHNQLNKSHFISPFVVPVVTIVLDRSFPDIYTPKKIPNGNYEWWNLHRGLLKGESVVNYACGLCCNCDQLWTVCGVPILAWLHNTDYTLYGLYIVASLLANHKWCQ